MPSFSRDYFEFFGLERKLTVDLRDLQTRFYQLSRTWHPDRFSRYSSEEQQQALEASSVLNDGYRTLRDPARRAEYVLEQEGHPIGEQRAKDVPRELLEEVFELNMALDELRQGDESARGALQEAQRKFTAMQQDIDQQLESLFRRFDEAAPETASATEALREIRTALNRRRYVSNLIRDVERALNPEPAASEPVTNRL